MREFVVELKQKNDNGKNSESEEMQNTVGTTQGGKARDLAVRHIFMVVGPRDTVQKGTKSNLHAK